MSAGNREQIREQVRDALDFHPDEHLPCTQVLGIGLTEDVCEDDEALHRWLECRATELIEEEGESLGLAIATAFDAAEEQCDFFDLTPPEGRRRHFGPLEAQEVREREDVDEVVQGTLPGVEDAGEEEPPTLQPQRAPAEQGEQTGLGGGPSREEAARATEQARDRQRRQERQAEQDRPRTQGTLSGEQPARLSEFDGDDGDGPAPGWETGTSPSGHFVAEGEAPAGVGVIVAVRRGEAVDTATGQKVELETIIEVGNEVEVAGTHRSSEEAERQAREIIQERPGDVAVRLGGSGNR